MLVEVLQDQMALSCGHPTGINSQVEQIIGHLTMDNVSSDANHHKVINGTVIDKIESNLQNQYYNFYVYNVMSSAGNYVSPYLQFHYNYGYLQVVIHRNN